MDGTKESDLITAVLMYAIQFQTLIFALATTSIFSGILVRLEMQAKQHLVTIQMLLIPRPCVMDSSELVYLLGLLSNPSVWY